MQRSIRVLHKYFSLIVSIQLLLWTVSGIFFAFNKIELIRGEGYLLSNDDTSLFKSPEFIVQSSDVVTVMKRLDKTVFIIKDNDGVKYLDFRGEELAKLTPKESYEIVRNMTTLTPKTIYEINQDVAGSEYRGRLLPLYRITSYDKNDKEINVYINPFSGKIEAIRTFSWRIWDFLWGLHIIDWNDRDNINNIFLQIFSLLALVSSITGIILFFRTLKKP
tara:strand:- start:10697 stop:11356 length:660 start_codon:yes stop_codon:yes gene_type:complete